jgi:hypothetical protein
MLGRIMAFVPAFPLDCRQAPDQLCFDNACSGVPQRNGKRDHDHAGKGKIQVHEVFIQKM